jgi:hypothetical protein
MIQSFSYAVPATEEKFRNVTLKKPRDWAELDLNRSLVSHPSTGPGTAVQP